MTEPDGDLSERAPKSLRQPVAAAALSTLLFAAMMASQGGLKDPLFAVASGDWYVASGAFGERISC